MYRPIRIGEGPVDGLKACSEVVMDKKLTERSLFGKENSSMYLPFGVGEGPVESEVSINSRLTWDYSHFIR